MLIHPTVERLRALGLTAMADAFIEMQNAPEAAELTREDWLGLLVDVILRSRPHPEQGFRSCVGILRLVKRYGAERVDAACTRALVLGTRSYTSVAAILKNHRERAPAGRAEPPLLIHENIRGPGYYH